jgi:phage terminase large subunit-like protein
MTATLQQPRPTAVNVQTLETLVMEDDFAEFMKRAWWVIEPYTTLVWGRVNDALCQHLQAVTENRIRQLLITIAPGCTKTITASICYPVWSWIREPGLRFLTAGNDRDLVLTAAVNSRELIRSEWFQERWGHRFRLAFDQDVKNYYKNDKRGFRNAVTAGQRVTGKKSDIQICDDLDDAMGVRSAVERVRLHNWFDKAFYNRVNDHRTARRIMIAQCLDVDDMVAHVKKRGDFVHLNLPEEFSPSERCTTPIGWSDWRTEPGELLRPELFGPEQVEEAKARLRTSYSGQHNQKPIGEGGDKFKAEWLRYYSPGEHRDQWLFGDLPVAPHEVGDRFLTVDPAFTEKKTTGKKAHDPDWTVVSAWGQLKKNGYVVWLGCMRFRCEAPEAPPLVHQMYARWGARRVFIEANGPQVAIFQLCERHQPHMSCIPVKPSTDKLDQAGNFFSLAQAGRVWLPSPDVDRTFPLTDVESELLEFPGGLHDDIVSTASIMGNEIGPKDKGKRTVQMIGSGNRAGPLDPRQMPGQPGQGGVPTYRPPGNFGQQ